jgi:hypothetical protein
MSIKQLVVLSVTTLALLATTATADSFIRKSFPCPNDKDTDINLSFRENANTIYFNNHCSEAMTIYYLKSGEADDWQTGFTVNAGTHGSDSVDYGVVSVTSY